MFGVQQLRNIIKVSLQPLTAAKYPLYTPGAEEILLMIAAHESRFGLYNKQQGGPALGLCQIEPATMRDNYANYLHYRKDLAVQVAETSGCSEPSLEMLQYNPVYNIIHARLKLYRSPGALPAATEIYELAAYAKRYYNGPGAATAEKYARAYNDIVIHGGASPLLA